MRPLRRHPLPPFHFLCLSFGCFCHSMPMTEAGLLRLIDLAFPWAISEIPNNDADGCPCRLQDICSEPRAFCFWDCRDKLGDACVELQQLLTAWVFARVLINSKNGVLFARSKSSQKIFPAMISVISWAEQSSSEKQKQKLIVEMIRRGFNEGAF